MRFVVVERETRRLRQVVLLSNDASFFTWRTPADWPPCDRVLVPDNYQEGDPLPEDSMEHYFILHNREGAIASVHVARTQTDFDGFRAGTHYAFGLKKRPVTLEEAEAIAFDGPERWLIESLDDATGAGALKRKK